MISPPINVSCATIRSFCAIGEIGLGLEGLKNFLQCRMSKSDFAQNKKGQSGNGRIGLCKKTCKTQMPVLRLKRKVRR
jgi:hypothetical protein